MTTAEFPPSQSDSEEALLGDALAASPHANVRIISASHSRASGSIGVPPLGKREALEMAMRLLEGLHCADAYNEGDEGAAGGILTRIPYRPDDSFSHAMRV